MHWVREPHGPLHPDDLWSQVDQIIHDLMGDWSNARFTIVFEPTPKADEGELRIEFEAIDE